MCKKLLATPSIKLGIPKENINSLETCGVISLIHEQSQDINQGVDRAEKKEQGAGDQGIMFGYASNETDNYMPLALDLSHKLLIELAALRRENKALHIYVPMQNLRLL